MPENESYARENAIRVIGRSSTSDDDDSKKKKKSISSKHYISDGWHFGRAILNMFSVAQLKCMLRFFFYIFCSYFLVMCERTSVRFSLYALALNQT